MRKKAGALVYKDPKGEIGRAEGLLRPADEVTADHPGRMYQADLAGLSPCTQYSYRLEPFETEGFPHRVRTPAGPGGHCRQRVRFVVYGDSRTVHETHRKLMPALEKRAPQLVLNVGDVVHSALDIDQWHVFLDIEKRLLADAAILLVPGNHEPWKHPRLGAAMLRRYFRVGDKGGTGHHSFDFGPVHFVMLDLYWGEPLDGAGLKWLEKDLEAVPLDRHRVVLLHEPPITFSSRGQRESVRRLRPLFKELKVQVVFAGHAHLYEHFSVDGVHFITTGGHGAPLHTPLLQVVEGEKSSLVKTEKIHNFVMVDVDESGLHLSVVDSMEDRVVESWDVAPPSR